MAELLFGVADALPTATQDARHTGKKSPGIAIRGPRGSHPPRARRREMRERAVARGLSHQRAIRDDVPAVLHLGTDTALPALTLLISGSLIPTALGAGGRGLGDTGRIGMGGHQFLFAA